jgi:hypothetical protein
MRNKLLGSLMILLITCTILTAQERDFNFKRKLPGVKEDAWYTIVLPDDLYQSLNENYSDLRLFQVTGSDTLETPYLIRTASDETRSVSVELKSFNKSTQSGKLFISFEVPTGQSVNYAELDFEEDNFDANVSLEGSDDGKSWFGIISKQRIVALKNDGIDFSASTITFPDTKYKFLRATIEGQKLTFLSATFRKNTTIEGRYATIEKKFTTTEDKAAKQTMVDIILNNFQPMERLSIDVDHHADYYRYYSLEVLQDSAQTPKGWTYYYTPISAGYLTSLRPNEISFPLTSAKKLRLVVFNEDNAPLKITDIKLSRPEIQVVSKLSAGKDYYLFYGNDYAAAPSYDLVHFTNKIPDSTLTIKPDAEVSIGKTPEEISPLIQNKVWLWAIMGGVILLLGFFTLKMMKNKA